MFSFNLYSPVYFADVILADIFTSFGRVTGDIVISIVHFISGDAMGTISTLHLSNENEKDLIPEDEEEYSMSWLETLLPLILW